MAVPVSRGGFFAAALGLCWANGMAVPVIRAVAQSGWSGALADTFGVSIVVWAASGAGIALVLRHQDGRLTATDMAVAAGATALAAVPFGALSWTALALLSLYVIATAEPGSPARRGALILLAVTVPMCWSRVAFAVVSPWLLQADAVMVSLIVGTERIGNTVRFADGQDFFQIYPACSSLANMSLAVLAWVAAAQLAGHRASPRDLIWCGLAALCVMAVNVARIALIGLNREAFSLLHDGFGATLAGWLSLGLMAAVCAIGLRHELSGFAHEREGAASAPAGAARGRDQPHPGIRLTRTGAGALGAAALLLALPLKVAAGDAGRLGDPEALRARAAAFLEEQGFAVAAYAEADGPFLRAAKGACRVGIAEAAAQGWNRDGLRLLTGEGERLVFVDGGRVHAEQPLARTVLRHHATRLARAVGMQVSWRPTLAVTASAACAAEALPWGTLAELP
jgi:exosortase/archaeosortase family protein